MFPTGGETLDVNPAPIVGPLWGHDGVFGGHDGALWRHDGDFGDMMGFLWGHDGAYGFKGLGV